MSARTVGRLVLKDWYLHRVAVALLLGGALLGVALAALNGPAGRSVGTSLIISVFIALTFYLPLTTVLSERTEKTLPFVLSLPVSPSEYTAAKLLANLLLFLVPWSAAAVGARLALSGPGPGSELLASGLAPVLMLGFLVFFSFILSVAIITESMGWTIALTVILMFLMGNVAGQVLPRLSTTRALVQEVAGRGPAYGWTLGAELGVILALVALTFHQQSRKRDFL